ncbi:polymeric immunoglobulin receptor-like isoform X1 [Pelobates cultripes]|nr:polymeric immunoglobulin receptor-like isoform X1 [Pelobates cultripes]
MSRKTDCVTVVNSNGFVHQDFWGRVLMKDDQNKTGVVVLLNGLRIKDSALYRCGTGSFEEGSDWTDVHIYVDNNFLAPTRISKRLSGFVGGSVSAECLIPGHFSPTSMIYWCKWNEKGCVHLIDSCGFVQHQLKNRVILEASNQTQRSYHILMNQLRLRDAGFYWCGITDGHREQSFSVELIIQDNTTDFYNSTTSRGQHNTTDLYHSNTSRGQHNTSSHATYSATLQPATSTSQGQ